MNASDPVGLEREGVWVVKVLEMAKSLIKIPVPFNVVPAFRVGVLSQV